MEFLNTIIAYPWFWPSIKILIALGAGLPLIGILTRMLHTYLLKNANKHVALLAQKLVYYGGVALLGLTILSELGFSVATLLGAAGVVGVAIGFASQTSMSNVISGIFLLLEHAFAVGDFVEFDGTSGTVESIDLFSVKIRTLDNTLVRVPNESLLKKNIVNYSYFPERKLSFTITVPYNTDIKNVVTQTENALQKNSLVIAPPDIRIDEFLDTTCSLRIRVLIKSDTLAQARQQLLAAVKKELNTAGLKPTEMYLGFTSANSQIIKVRMPQQ